MSSRQLPSRDCSYIRIENQPSQQLCITKLATRVILLRFTFVPLSATMTILDHAKHITPKPTDTSTHGLALLYLAYWKMATVFPTWLSKCSNRSSRPTEISRTPAGINHKT